MSPDMAPFREKLVRLQQQVSSAIAYIDGDGPMKADYTGTLKQYDTGFLVGDFAVTDRFKPFTKEPQ